MTNASKTEQSQQSTVAYCARCRTKRSMVEAHAVPTKTGGSYLKGRCATCGATVTLMQGARSGRADQEKI